MAYRLFEPQYPEAALAEGSIDFWESCRAMIADPMLPTKIREGREEDIIPCMACNICLARLFRDAELNCFVRPSLGHETEEHFGFYGFPKAEKKRRVWIIGAGIAGMQAGEADHLARQVVDVEAAVGEPAVRSVEIAELGLGGDHTFETSDQMCPFRHGWLLQCSVWRAMPGGDGPPRAYDRIPPRRGRARGLTPPCARGDNCFAMDQGPPEPTSPGRADSPLSDEARLSRVLLDLSLDALIFMDRQGRVTEWSPGAERIFGHPRRAALGHELAGLIIPPALRERHRRGLARYLSTGDGAVLGTRVEMMAMRADGHEFPVEVYVMPLDLQGGPAFLGCVRDRTAPVTAAREKAQLESDLRQAQTMEAAGRLAGSVANEFSNLVTVIAGRSHMLLSHLPEGGPLRREIEVIEKTAQRAAALITQMLAFSWRQELQLRVLDASEAVARAAAALRGLLGERIELVIRVAPERCPIRADPEQLEQVLVNLADNSRDAMPEGGRLTVETATVPLDEAGARASGELRPGRYVSLTVSDTGSGMDEHTRTRAFEPFFTTKPAAKAAGLGLSTVYGIVRQSGGDVHIASEPGRGTTVTILLPRAGEAAEGDRPAALLEGAQAASETVLLAEDDDEVREMTADILGKAGYTVISEVNGTRALDLARRHMGPIQVLVADLVMPTMNGRELARRLKLLRPDIKVLYVSGYVRDEAARAAIAGEDAAFLPKPFTPTALIAAVSALLVPRSAPGP